MSLFKKIFGAKSTPSAEPAPVAAAKEAAPVPQEENVQTLFSRVGQNDDEALKALNEGDFALIQALHRVIEEVKSDIFHKHDNHSELDEELRGRVMPYIDNMLSSTSNPALTVQFDFKKLYNVIVKALRSFIEQYEDCAKTILYHDELEECFSKMDELLKDRGRINNEYTAYLYYCYVMKLYQYAQYCKFRVLQSTMEAKIELDRKNAELKALLGVAEEGMKTANAQIRSLDNLINDTLVMSKQGENLNVEGKKSMQKAMLALHERSRKELNKARLERLHNETLWAKEVVKHKQMELQDALYALETEKIHIDMDKTAAFYEEEIKKIQDQIDDLILQKKQYDEDIAKKEKILDTTEQLQQDLENAHNDEELDSFDRLIDQITVSE